MNRVALTGRFTAKPELRYTQSNTAYTRFSVAVNRNFTNANGEREADFINVVAWKKQAETITEYFDKGSQIALEGRLQTGSYTDKEGNKRSITDVVLENFEFIGTKKEKEEKSNSEIIKDTMEGKDPYGNVFEEFGEQISLGDNYLE